MAERIVFVGDSITDAGRMEDPGGLGYGYVARVARQLANREGVEVHNRGIGGNTIRDLSSRWTRDVLEMLPTTVVLMIGINDVWRKMEGILGQAVPVAEFDEIYRDLVRRTLEGRAERIILLEPFLVEPNLDDPFRVELIGHQAVVKSVAQENGLAFVPLQDLFDKACQTRSPASLAGDRVHPTEEGHDLIAQAVIREIGS